MKSFTLRHLLDISSYAMDDLFVTKKEADVEVGRLNQALWHRNTDIVELRGERTTALRKVAVTEEKLNAEKRFSSDLRQQLDAANKVHAMRETHIVGLEHRLNAEKTKNTSLTNRNVELWSRALNAEGTVSQLQKRLTDAVMYAAPAPIVINNPFALPDYKQPMWQFKGAGAFEYDPNTKTVQVPVSEMTRLVEKAHAYRYGASITEYAGQVFPYNPSRDTVEVTRSLWTIIHNDIANLKAFRFRIAEALGTKEGEDIVSVAKQVVNDLAKHKSLVVEQQPAFLRLERENQDLRTILRQQNNYAQKQTNKIARLRNSLASIKDAAGKYIFTSYGNNAAEISAACDAMVDIRDLCRAADNPKPTTGEKSATPGSSV